MYIKKTYDVIFKLNIKVRTTFAETLKAQKNKRKDIDKGKIGVSIYAVSQIFYCMLYFSITKNLRVKYNKIFE